MTGLGLPAQLAELGGTGKEKAEFSLGRACFCPLGEKQRQVICNILSSAGDLLLLGKCLDCYWQQKKCMAPGCEPLAVGRMMDTLRPYIHGQCLAGAGGGGFLYILTKAPRQKEALHHILANTEVSCEPRTVAGSLQQPYIEHKEHLSPPHMECDCLFQCDPVFQCPSWDLAGVKGSFVGSCPNL